MQADGRMAWTVQHPRRILAGKLTSFSTSAQRGVPTGTSPSPAGTSICATKESSSMVRLMLKLVNSTSHSASPVLTLSPSFFVHALTLPNFSSCIQIAHAYRANATVADAIGAS
jgi:hypothetical protein